MASSRLKGDTAQGNALGTLAACVDRIVVLTGTLSGGYADDLHRVLFRLDPGKMVGRGYDWGESGRRVRRNIRRGGKNHDDRAVGQRVLQGARHQPGEA